jgi:hypothetical protein
VSNSGTAEALAKRGPSGLRGRPPTGRLPVGDYTGQAAGDAAQAVRRAGLRPGLDRSFGYDPDLIGRVVSQEPLAGSELARNAMVTLYVAAPGPAAADERAAEHPARLFEPAVLTVGAEPAFSAEDSARQAEPTPRRRRKRRPADRPSRGFDTPPAAVRVETAPAPIVSRVRTDIDPAEESPSDELAATEAPDGSEPPHEATDHDGYDDPSHEEFVAHADDLFAGRTTASWRRVYPARPRLTSSGNQPQRRWSR